MAIRSPSPPSYLALPPDGLRDEVLELLSTHGDVLEPLASQDDLTSREEWEGGKERTRSEGKCRSRNNTIKENMPFTLHSTTFHNIAVDREHHSIIIGMKVLVSMSAVQQGWPSL